MSRVVDGTDILFRVEYYLEGTRVSSIECRDTSIVLKEVLNKMMMDLRHLEGKTVHNHTGREL